MTRIEWTDATWNPVTGCDKVGAGCDHCYAERFAERFRGVRGHPYERGFDLQLRPDRLTLPLAWKRPRMIFTCSMGDPFHKQVPDLYLDAVFESMERADWHVFQVLTKRSSRMRDYMWKRYGARARRGPPAHIWCGVSIEDSRCLSRATHLTDTPAAVRFISAEPLIGHLAWLPLRSVQWVIVGGESGPGARPMEPDWARDLRDRCVSFGVSFFFKQWGGRTPRSAGRLLDGREWNERPPWPGT